MSVFKSQFSRALAVIKSDNADIPYPAQATSGTNTSVTVGSLVSSSSSFVSNNVRTGDIVYNITDGTAATVVNVISETQVSLNADIFLATSKSYIIYQASPQTTIGNEGCNIYVGGTGSLVVTTIGGDIVTFSGVAAGTVLPVQVLKVASASTATLLTALW